MFIIFCVCLSFPFDFEGGMWELIVLIPDHCLFYLLSICLYFKNNNRHLFCLTDEEQNSFICLYCKKITKTPSLPITPTYID